MTEKLKGYGVDPFSNDYPICLSTEEKIGIDVLKDMNNVEKICKKKMNEFIQDRLIDGKVSFFERIKKTLKILKRV